MPGRIRLDDGENKVDVPGKCVCRVEPGARLIFDTPGGGGFGKPELRKPAQLSRDINEGLVSVDAAEKLYGHKYRQAIEQQSAKPPPELKDE